MSCNQRRNARGIERSESIRHNVIMREKVFRVWGITQTTGGRSGGDRITRREE